MKFIQTLIAFTLFLSQGIYSQNSLCELVSEIECGIIDGNNDTGIFITEEYCGSSTNLTGPEQVYLIVAEQTMFYTFELSFNTGDLDMFLLDSNCDRHII